MAPLVQTYHTSSLYDGTQESYRQLRPYAEPLNWIHGVVLSIGPVCILLGLALHLGGLLGSTEGLALLGSGVFVFISVLFVFSETWMGHLRRMLHTQQTLGFRVKTWPTWTLQEQDLHKVAQARLGLLLHAESESTREVAQSLAQNFEGTLSELAQASRNLSR